MRADRAINSPSVGPAGPTMVHRSTQPTFFRANTIARCVVTAPGRWALHLNLSGIIRLVQRMNHPIMEFQITLFRAAQLSCRGMRFVRV